VLGKRLELIYQDDTSKPEVASLTVEKLADRSDIVALMELIRARRLFPLPPLPMLAHPVICPSATTDEITRQGYQWCFVCARRRVTTDGRWSSFLRRSPMLTNWQSSTRTRSSDRAWPEPPWNRLQSRDRDCGL